MRSIVRVAFAAATAIAAVLIGAGGLIGGGAGTASAATSGVSIRGIAFSPNTVNIKVGEAVRWIDDEDAIPHTVTSEKYGGFASATMRPGDSFMHTFTEAGSYQYFCLVHPGMRGVVNVGDATGTPGTRPAALAAAPISLRLSGANEVPPVTTSAQATFNATVGANSITFGLQGFAVGITAAHIHVGAAGVNGPVVAFLFGPDPGQNQITSTGTIDQSKLVGPMAGKYADFAAALARGELYVNLHTIANPAGHIRVQIPAQAAATPRPPATGSGLRATPDSGGFDLMPLMAAAFVVSVAGGAAAWKLRRR